MAAQGEVSRLVSAVRCKLVPRVQFSSHPEHMNSGGRPALASPAPAATQLMPAHAAPGPSPQNRRV